MDTKWILFAGFMFFVGQFLAGAFSLTGLSSATVPTKGYVITNEQVGNLTVIPAEGEEVTLSELLTGVTITNFLGRVVEIVKLTLGRVGAWITLDYDFLDNPVGNMFSLAVWIPLGILIGIKSLLVVRRFLP